MLVRKSAASGPVKKFYAMPPSVLRFDMYFTWDEANKGKKNMARRSSLFSMDDFMSVFFRV